MHKMKRDAIPEETLTKKIEDAAIVKEIRSLALINLLLALRCYFDCTHTLNS